MQEPFEDSRRLTGCNVYFAAAGAALETARGLTYEDAALERWGANVAIAREMLAWPDAEIVVRKHRSGVSLAFVAPLDQLYAATEVNEWAWWSAVAFSFPLRGKVPEGRMREGALNADTPIRKKLPLDAETQAFIKTLRRNSTDAEHLIWSYVRGRRLHGQKFRRQQALGPYVLDFYCHDLKLAIELDGGQHNEPSLRAQDARRDAYVLARGISTLRYWNHDVLERTEKVLSDIWDQIQRRLLPETHMPRTGGLPPSSALRAPSPEGGREVQGLYHAPGFAAIWDSELALRTLRAAARAEARPQLVALQQAAHARGLPMLIDDELVSIGAGCGGRAWRIDALPAADGVEWSALHAIPTALVTGSNGKTTSVRLIAAMTTAHGLATAHSCTDGVFFDGIALESGDFSGPGGARVALRQSAAQAAILETARGGMLRRGLALCTADVALVTNISADHFGEYGVHDLDDLAKAKLTVARAIGNDGLLVLNADDPVLVRQSQTLASPIGWFGLDDTAPILLAHRQHGGATCAVGAGCLRLHYAGAEHDLGAVAEMPLTLGGSARYNIANIAGAALAAAALGVAPATIAAVLGRFGDRREDNPGRLQRWRFGDLQVVVDYAHNPDGLHGLLRAVGADERSGRLAITLGHAGNREDDDLRAVAATAAAFVPDYVLLKDAGGYERGRSSGEIAAIMWTELLRMGVPEQAVETRLDEVAASRAALAWARDGDLVVMPVFAMSAREKLGALLERMQAQQWKPGQVLPEDEPEDVQVDQEPQQ